MYRIGKFIKLSTPEDFGALIKDYLYYSEAYGLRINTPGAEFFDHYKEVSDAVKSIGVLPESYEMFQYGTSILSNYNLIFYKISSPVFPALHRYDIAVTYNRYPLFLKGPEYIKTYTDQNTLPLYKPALANGAHESTSAYINSNGSINLDSSDSCSRVLLTISKDAKMRCHNLSYEDFEDYSINLEIINRFKKILNANYISNNIFEIDLEKN